MPEDKHPFHRHAGAFDPMTNFRDAPLEFTSWPEEQRSWVEGCYIHAGLNPAGGSRISGPDAPAMLNRICTNNVAAVKVGASTHAVLVTPRGHVTASGMIFREAEDAFFCSFHQILIDYHVAAGDWDVRVDNVWGKRFLFQVAGPRSLEVLERAFGEDLHDIRFFRHRGAPVGTRNLELTGSELSVLRLGMAGTLAYEVHGDAADAGRVYEAILEAGTPLGIRQLGSLTYITSHHTLNGFPNTYVHYPPAFAEDEAMVAHMRATGALTDTVRPWPDLRGSMGPELSERFVTPLDLNWFHAVKFDHDFIGRAALEPLAERPPRRTVTLLWNSEDVLDVFRSRFRPEPRHPVMTLPGDDVLKGPLLTIYNDRVLSDGRPIGMSMGRMYSEHYGEMLSLGTIAVEEAELGNELTVLWGDPGTHQKAIRATVARFPYLDLPRNEQVDTETIPRLAAAVTE